MHMTAAQRGDLIGGASSALVLLTVHGSYGVVAIAPLGPAWAPAGFLMGVFAAVVSNALSALAGDRGPLISGPSSALVLLVSPLLASLIARPALRGADGAADPVLLLALVAIGITLAGVAQALIGQLRLGSIVRYVPYPVHAGFMLAVAVLMIMVMLPHALGQHAGEAAAMDAARPLSMLVAVVSVAITMLPASRTGRVPPLLLALLVGSLLHHGLAALAGPAALGPLLGTLEFRWPSADVTARVADPATWSRLPAAAGPVLQFALALALTASLQALLAGSVVDGWTGRHHDGDRLLRGQGLANIGCGLLGLMPAAAAVASSAVNMQAGGHGTASRLAHAAGLVAALTVGVLAMGRVPMAVIAGIFIATGWSLLDGWTRQALREVTVQLVRWRRLPADLARPAAVVALVAAVALATSLITGVMAGLVVAMLLFVRSHMRSPVRRVVGADQQASRRVRPPGDAALLRAHGGRIQLVELEGALFFGTAHVAGREIERVAAGAQALILDLRRVGELDVSGARLMAQTAARLQRTGIVVALAGLRPDDPRARQIRGFDTAGALPPARFHDDVDRALEAEEDALLSRLGAAGAADAPLPLARTLLGDGLDADALATLASMMQAQHVAKGDVVFRRGDPGDALYLLRQGRIAIMVPAAEGPARRLVSFAPGVVFGEIGLLRHQPRTADALAEEDSRLDQLDRAAWETLARDHPALHARLLQQLALHLSDRLGALTRELDTLDGGPAPAPAPAAGGQGETFATPAGAAGSTGRPIGR